jgi:hypothetical protein
MLLETPRERDRFVDHDVGTRHRFKLIFDCQYTPLISRRNYGKGYQIICYFTIPYITLISQVFLMKIILISHGYCVGGC